ncbi:MAG TPA: alpha/beta fold hydrolase [Acidimicrobiales bacterium]
MATLSLNGIDLYYELTGTGPRLLFLNGTGATVANTEPIVAVLAGAFEVAAFDQRGIGRSTLAADPYTVADLAGDALAVADHLGWERFRLIGVSFGGMVAQELAVTAPHRIERLALLCTSSGGAGGSSFPLQTLADLDPTERALVVPPIIDSRFTPDWLDGHKGDRALVALLTERFTLEKTPHVLAGEAMQLGARSRHDVFERLPRIACPTLVASGRYDGIAPPENSVAIASQIPNAKLQSFDGGHLFFVQDPSAFPEIVEFLGTG